MVLEIICSALISKCSYIPRNVPETVKVCTERFTNDPINDLEGFIDP